MRRKLKVDRWNWPQNLRKWRLRKQEMDLDLKPRHFLNVRALSACECETAGSEVTKSSEYAANECAVSEVP